MATGGGHGIAAGADLSAKQHYIIVLDTSGDAQLSDATNRGCLGVLANKPESGEGVKFYVVGDITGQVVIGSTFTIGEGIVSDSAGKGIPSSDDEQVVVGMSLQAGVSGDTIKYLVRDPHSPDYDKEFLS